MIALQSLSPDLEIRSEAVRMGDLFFETAEYLETRELPGFAVQLRGAGMSISRCLASKFGMSSRQEFESFLKTARRSAFEAANILSLLHRRDLIDNETLRTKIRELDRICRKLASLHKSLLTRKQ